MIGHGQAHPVICHNLGPPTKQSNHTHTQQNHPRIKPQKTHPTPLEPSKKKRRTTTPHDRCQVWQVRLCAVPRPVQHVLHPAVAGVPGRTRGWEHGSDRVDGNKPAVLPTSASNFVIETKKTRVPQEFKEPSPSGRLVVVFWRAPLSILKGNQKASTVAPFWGLEPTPKEVQLSEAEACEP